MRLQGFALSGTVDPLLVSQSVPSHIILCTSTPSPYIDGLAWKYGIQVFVRNGESNIRDDWNFAYEMADGELVTIAHQDDMYHKEYVERLLATCRAYPDMTVFTTDYVIVKNGRLITGDAMLWVKRILRLPLRVPALNDRAWIKKMSLIFGNPICCPATTYQKKLLGTPLVRSEYRFALDWDNLYQLACEKGRFICDERPLLYYRVHDEAIHQGVYRGGQEGRGGGGHVQAVLARAGRQAADAFL